MTPSVIGAPRPYAYATTHRLEQVDAVLPDGRAVTLLRKDLAADAVLPEARGTRPDSLVDPAREVAVYARLVGDGTLAPRCHAAVADGRGEYWLLLEQVPGVELWQVADLDVWAAVAAWLAGLHDRLGHHRDDPELPLLRYDRAFYEQWPRRALAFAEPEQRPTLRKLAERHAAVVDALLAMPQAVIHGDCHPSNVLVRTDSSDVEVRVVDWELAAVGPALVDLAALCAGWPEHERSLLIAAYAEAAGAPCDDAFVGHVDRCELHLCLQWLGWAPGWMAPPEHARDWLARAVELSERL